MSSQDFTLLGKLALAMPTLSREQMQFWIENPKKFQQFLQGLTDTELRSIYETPTEVSMMCGTFDPIHFLLNNPKVKLNHTLDVLLRNYSSGQVTFKDKVRYTYLKKAATNSAIRRDLPEQHLFKDDTAYQATLIANLLRNQLEFGSAVGFSPNMPNIFYFGTNEGNVYIKMIQAFGDDSWEVSTHQYNEERATAHMRAWPPTTRVFFPLHKE